MTTVLVHTKRRESAHRSGTQVVQAELQYAVYRETEYPQLGCRRILEFTWTYAPPETGWRQDPSIEDWLKANDERSNPHSSEPSL